MYYDIVLLYVIIFHIGSFTVSVITDQDRPVFVGLGLSNDSCLGQGRLGDTMIPLSEMSKTGTFDWMSSPVK